MIKVFYNDAISSIKTITPSSQKPAKFMRALLEKYSGKIEVISAYPDLTPSDICLAHESNYVFDILNQKRWTGYNAQSPELTKLVMDNNSSFCAAARSSLIEKTITMSPTSGFHHATYNSAGGFCTFNGLIIAAQLLKLSHGVNKVTIIDFDAHWGNGTEDIISKLGLSYIHNISFPHEFNKALDGEDFIDGLESMLIERVTGSDIVFFQAGADPHVADPLGGYLTGLEMMKRDRVIFEVIKRLNIPMVWNLAGGYQIDFDKVIELHMTTFDEYFKTFSMEKKD